MTRAIEKKELNMRPFWFKWWTHHSMGCALGGGLRQRPKDRSESGDTMEAEQKNFGSGWGGFAASEAHGSI